VHIVSFDASYYLLSRVWVLASALVLDWPRKDGLIRTFTD
jgi:hypothetical protein